ncbi:bifunctional Fibronectin type II domain superfamily/PA14 domain/PA14-GLEYA domain [Babesia duncani]|uniref:Bifunctional Fibronectin type II domain superfamily/PA14 domain/PA14-GLEYA domain n=1 Tax=Babesia duncani TaxID=323732 RepID=A0AAD9UP86_9APIC|nr:bifunctional Fibronectin type II domain superfamily/PA14 domain/PA14-GLEYA domain [Babesia duncani]
MLWGVLNPITIHVRNHKMFKYVILCTLGLIHAINCATALTADPKFNDAGIGQGADLGVNRLLEPNVQPSDVFNNDKVASNASFSPPSAENGQNDTTSSEHISATPNIQNAAITDDNELLYLHTQYRNSPRRTLDGHLCAAAFVHANNVYTDCTMEVAPDGSSDKEWCYLEAQLTGKLEKDWGFCEPLINYERVRAAAAAKVAKKVAQVDELRESMETYRRLLSESDRRLEHACGTLHRNTGDRLAIVSQLLETAKDDMQQFRENENSVLNMKQRIEQCQCAHKAALQEVAKGGALPHGLVGTYFRGHLFRLPAIATRHDIQINFIFVDQMPILGLNPLNFSIRTFAKAFLHAGWDGYIRAPHFGNFTFEIETDAFCRMVLNGQELINNGIKLHGNDENGVYYGVDLDHYKKSGNLTSRSIQLSGGHFYSLRVEFSHSQQFKIDHGNESSIKLYWSSFRIHRQLVPPWNFYKQPLDSNISISGLPVNHFSIIKAENGAPACKNTRNIFMANLSYGLRDGLAVVTDVEPTVKRFIFQVNVPAILHVIYKHDSTFPLEASAESPLVFDHPTEHIDIYQGETKWAIQSKTAHLNPQVNYLFHVGAPGTFFTMIIKPSLQSTLKCEGAEQLVSVPGSSLFAACRQSSAHAPHTDCKAALSGRYLDIPGSIWRTGGGAGEWFVATLATTKPPGGHVESFKILYSGNVDDHYYPLQAPRILSSLKITIEELYLESSETGGSFGIWGIACKKPTRTQVYGVSDCALNLQDVLGEVPIQEQMTALVRCPHICLTDAQTANPGLWNSLGQLVKDVAPFKHTEQQKEKSSSGNSTSYPISSSVCDAFRTSGQCANPQESCTLELHVGRMQNGELEFTLKNPIEKVQKFQAQVLFRQGLDDQGTEEMLVDNGSIKSLRGDFNYGWLRPATGTTCTSDSIYYGGGIEFPPPTESMRCIQSESCEANFWSMDVPINGKYKLEIVVGSVCSSESQIAHLQINGQNFINGQEFPQGQVYVVVKNVTITNGLLKLTSYCFGESTCTAQKTLVQYLKIKLVKPINEN